MSEPRERSAEDERRDDRDGGDRVGEDDSGRVGEGGGNDPRPTGEEQAAANRAAEPPA